MPDQAAARAGFFVTREFSIKHNRRGDSGEAWRGTAKYVRWIGLLGSIGEILRPQ